MRDIWIISEGRWNFENNEYEPSPKLVRVKEVTIILLIFEYDARVSIKFSPAFYTIKINK